MSGSRVPECASITPAGHCSFLVPSVQGLLSRLDCELLLGAFHPSPYPIPTSWPAHVGLFSGNHSAGFAQWDEICLYQGFPALAAGYNHQRVLEKAPMLGSYPRGSDLIGLVCGLASGMFKSSLGGRKSGNHWPTPCWVLPLPSGVGWDTQRVAPSTSSVRLHGALG